MAEGGWGGRQRGIKRKEESPWTFGQEIVNEDDSDSDFSTSSKSTIESEDEEEWDTDDDLYVSDMIGNRLLPINRLSCILEQCVLPAMCSVKS